MANKIFDGDVNEDDGCLELRAKKIKWRRGI